MVEDAVRAGIAWAAQVDGPWFLAGALGVGVPVGLAAASMVTDNCATFSLVTAVAGLLGGAAADTLSTTCWSYITGGCTFTCYDVLIRGLGPACLLLVVLIPEIRRNGYGNSSGGKNKGRAIPELPPALVSVNSAAIAALAFLLLEPLVTAAILGGHFTVDGNVRASTTGFASFAARGGRAAGSGGVTAFLRSAVAWPFGLILDGFDTNGGRRRNKASATAAAKAFATAVSRIRWLTGGAQLALWAATMLSLGRIALRSARESRGARRTVGTYMSALRELASRKRGTGVWARTERPGVGASNQGGRGTAPNSPVPGGEGRGWGEEGYRPRTHSVLGSLYERLAGGWKGGDDSCLNQAICPPFERGEVTVRGLHCTGLDVALTGKAIAAVNYGVTVAGAGNCADRGGGIAGGESRPFYVSVTLGNVTARTSVRTGFSPTFTEVFPLGIDCPIKGAFLAIKVVDSFETGRSGRGDRVIGEAHIPVDAAGLVPGSLADLSGGGPTYRLQGEWELRGVIGGACDGPRVGVEIVVRGPPDPNSAAGRLKRRESVGWYAR